MRDNNGQRKESLLQIHSMQDQQRNALNDEEFEFGRGDRDATPFISMASVTILVFMLGIVLLDVFTQTSLREAGVTMLSNLQTSWDSETSDNYFKFVHYTGTFEALMIAVVVIYQCVGESQGLVLLILMPGADLANQILAMLYGYPRPYWVDISVEGKICDASFGMPSRVGMLSMIFYLTVGTQLNRWLVNRNGGETQFKSLFVASIWLGCLTQALMSAISQMYLGQAFPDQVMIAWMFGLATMILFGEWQRSAVLTFARAELLEKTWAYLLSLLVILCTLAFFAYIVILDASVDSLWEIYAGVWCETTDDPYVIDKRVSFLMCVGDAAFIIAVLLGRRTLKRKYSAKWFNVGYDIRAARLFISIAGVVCVWGAYILLIDPHTQGLVFMSVITMTLYFLVGLVVTLGGPMTVYYLVDFEVLHPPENKIENPFGGMEQL